MTTSTPSFPPVDDVITLVKKIDWADVRKRARKGVNNCGLVIAVVGEKLHDFGAFLAQLWYVFTYWSRTVPLDPWGSSVRRRTCSSCIPRSTSRDGRTARDTRPDVRRTVVDSPPFGVFPSCCLWGLLMFTSHEVICDHLNQRSATDELLLFTPDPYESEGVDDLWNSILTNAANRMKTTQSLCTQSG